MGEGYETDGPSPRWRIFPSPGRDVSTNKESGMGRSARARGAIAAVAAAAITIGVVVTPSSGATAGGKRADADAVPSWAKQSRKVGEAHGSVQFSLVLPWRDRAGLRAFNAAVSNPRSASYAHYLT